jgi:branched-chain amino acid transport system permease protein
VSIAGQVIFNGLSFGATLALMALGLTLVFGILRIVNFAHGVLFMVGAYTTFFVVEKLGWSYFIAVIAAAAASAAVAVILSLTVFRRFKGLLLEGAIAATMLALLLESAAIVWFKPVPRTVNGPFGGVVDLGGVHLSVHRLFVIGVAVVVVVLLQVFVARSRQGRALRAVQQDAFVARLQGISVDRTMVVTFALGGALAGLAGALVAPEQVLLPTMGTAPLLLAFVIVIVGGLGSVKGGLYAAIVIGLMQSSVSTYWTPEAATWTSFLAALAILTFRPTGLFGHE